ncbi:DUF2642 domain-containing protein [Risungbinella massiliensis]|uniref:DUF2642 domain-containing protein n=1 Tax=Risungbinella massiliensis TaxID=1329796 RepID=UPI00069CAAC2|nr:DUF2642 domain-containing protein [Risungbinella massiliensis]
MHKKLTPIVQPMYVNQQPTVPTYIFSEPVVPQSNQYITNIEPVFVDHLSRHRGQRIIVTTTIGEIEGVLTGVAVDHIQLDVSEKALHIRIAQIVSFEGFPISYEEKQATKK